MEEKKNENSSGNLEDIILGKDKKGDKSEGIKKILLIAASLILLFLIVLVVMKLVSQPAIDEESSALSPENENIQNIETLNNNEKLQDIQKEETQVINEDNTLFKEVPIMQEEEDAEFEAMVKKLKEDEEKIKKQVEKKLKEKDVKQRDINDALKEESESKQNVEVVDAKLEKLEKDLNDMSKNLQKREQTIKTVTSKPVAKKISSLSGYYIQVGATYQVYPDKAFLEKIKSNGFSYIIHKVTIAGKDVRKVLVGPYKSKTEANKYLGSVRATLRADAFIYRVR